MNALKDRLSNSTEFVAAADLGSNSFHLVVGRLDYGRLIIVDRIREFVRLGGGLDANLNLTPEAQNRALDCLGRFRQRIQDIPSENVRAVGTNTLRKAHNAREFLEKAEQKFGHSIEIITGREEARLIYESIYNLQQSNGIKRLVIDIGGGSTEIITGKSNTPVIAESLHIGCVSMSQNYFSNGIISEKRLQKAVLDAELEIENVSHSFNMYGHKQVIGCSGTIRAIGSVASNSERNSVVVTRKKLNKLRKKILNFTHTSKLVDLGFEPERCDVLPGGFAILWALFELLEIDEMQVSDQALREGVLYDLLGRMHNKDIRQQTVSALASNWSIDKEHAHRVKATAMDIFDQVAADWSINVPECRNLLSWAATLHEIGLSMSHAQYHKHGCYILQHSDLDGFSQIEQTELALLVRGHRQKFPTKEFLKEGALFSPDTTQKLCVILRAAVLMNRSRSSYSSREFLCSVHQKELKLTFPKNWLEKHPLTRESLVQEQQYLQPTNYKLEVVSSIES